MHGTGSLGDFLSHMMLIQEFCRRFGPVQIDFYTHPKKVDEAKFIFARTHFVRTVQSVQYLPMLRHNYDLIIHSRYIVKYEIIRYQRVFDCAPELLDLIRVTTSASSRTSTYSTTIRCSTACCRATCISTR